MPRTGSSFGRSIVPFQWNRKPKRWIRLPSVVRRGQPHVNGHGHVKDVIGATCVLLGKGEVNIVGCLRVLKEHGYPGVLSLETEGEFDAEQGQRLIEASRTYLVGALAEL